MGNIMGVVWDLAIGSGILMNEAEDAWHSGHVSDILPLDGGASGLLVAAHTGGVWTATAAGATPLSNGWDQPDINCLAAGPDGPRHVYAGGDDATIYETRSDTVAPLLAWQLIDEPLPASAGNVRRILVLPRHQRMVAVCSGGIYWSMTVPAWLVRGFGQKRSSARYGWHEAIEVGGPSGGYFDGTVAATRDIERPGQDDLDFVTIVAGASAGGVWVGRWVETGFGRRFGSDLEMRQTFALPATAATSVCSSNLQASRVYAAASVSRGQDQQGALAGIGRSDDGGLTWRLVAAADSGGETLTSVVGEKGDAWNNCIAVAADRPHIIVLGWQNGTWMSVDGGVNWRQLLSQADLGPGNGHFHKDVHAFAFGSPGPGGGEALYVGSDGGVVEVDLASAIDFVVDGPAAGYPLCRSQLNRHLATLQCYATTNAADRQFSGTMAVHHHDGAEQITVGLQDNGNVFSFTGGGAPWWFVNAGDGGWNAMFGNSLFNNIMSDSVIRQYTVRPGPVIAEVGAVVVGRIGIGSLSPNVMEPVRRPGFRNADGDVMVQVAGAADGPSQRRGVYGLFADAGPTGTFHWELLGDIPENLAITAVASATGHLVWVGTSGGRIFALDSSAVTEPVETPVPPPTLPAGMAAPAAVWIMRIAIAREGVAAASLTASYSSNLSVSDVLRLDGLHWVNAGWTPAPGTRTWDRVIFGLEIVPRERSDVIFACTDSAVYATDNGGTIWHVVSDGLPARAHGSDLRYGFPGIAGPGRGAYLYLSTWGRSVWRASMDDLDHG